ncbi:hypothetical protein OSTOST_04830 [Ostertagia ostertagi]
MNVACALKFDQYALIVGIIIRCVRVRQYGSNLTTPPNSPEPELMTVFAYDVEPKSMSLHVVVGFIVSNIVTFVIGAAIGFVVCKRLVKERKI